MRFDSRLANPEDAEYILEIDDSLRRAIDAGAVPPLEFKGIGASAVVFCDSEGIAAKVYRHFRSPEFFEYKEREAEFLRDAAGSRVRDSVARFYGWDPELEVLFRECVEGSAGGRGTRGLSDLH